jgi:hypothetical protein
LYPALLLLSTKQKFLIDTGTDRCVFPRKLIPQRKERVNYDRSAANGTIIIYAWLPLILNTGLRGDFAWRFVVADVTQPLIGTDFLSHLSLLVTCRNNRLLDGITSVSASAQAASSLIPSVKVISDGTPFERLLSVFPDLTRPTGVQREVRHNTVHMSDIRQTSVAKQRLIDRISVVNNRRKNKETVGTSHMSDIRQSQIHSQSYLTTYGQSAMSGHHQGP